MPEESVRNASILLKQSVRTLATYIHKKYVSCEKGLIIKEHIRSNTYGTNQLQLKRCTRVTRTRHEMDTKCTRTRHASQTLTQFIKNACINALREHVGGVLNIRVPCVQDSVHACVSRVAKMLSEHNIIVLNFFAIRLPTLYGLVTCIAIAINV